MVVPRGFVDGVRRETCSANGEGDEEDCPLSIIAMLMAVATVLGYPAAAPGQEPQSRTAELTGFWLTTPHPNWRSAPVNRDDPAHAAATRTSPPQRASIEVSGIPQDWKWSLKAETAKFQR